MYQSNITVMNLSLNNSLFPEPPAWVVYSKQLKQWFYFTMLITLFGVMMNMLLLLTIIRDKALQKGSGLLIGHVVLIETITCAIHMPVNTIMTFTGGKYRDYSASCGFIHFIFMWTNFAGHWSAMLLACNRFVATMFPLSYRRFGSKRFVIGLIILSWIMAFLAKVAGLFGTGVIIERIGPWYSCGGRTVQPIIYTVSTAIGYYVPEVMIGVFYFAIFFRMALYKRHNHVSPSQNPVNNLHSFQSSRRLAVLKMLALSSLWYWFCYFPIPIIMSGFPEVFFKNPMYQLWSRTLFWCGYAFNPIIFFLMIREYRQGLAAMLRQCPCCKTVQNAWNVSNQVPVRS